MRAPWLIPLVITALAGCTGNPPLQSLTTPCSTPRPQVCTMEYAPVCAGLVAGGSKTYSSACNACADTGVSGHQPGKCEGDAS